MKDRSALTAAITAAINAYEEEAQVASIRSSMAPSLWRSSGREEIMRMGVLWQSRIFPRYTQGR